jgi:hypothetical protein
LFSGFSECLSAREEEWISGENTLREIRAEYSGQGIGGSDFEQGGLREWVSA